MYETIRIVEKLKPKYVIWENVKNLLSKKHRLNFDNYLDKMSELGYKNFYQVLNAKDYGIPQNRERVFTISIRKDTGYTFPKKEELKLKLKDMLEDQVDEKYYLSQKLVECFSSNGTGKYPRGERFRQNINRKNQDVANSIITTEGNKPTCNFIKVKNATKQGYDIAKDGDSINLQNPNSETRRARVDHGISNTLQTSDSMVVAVAQRGRENGQQLEISDREYANSITTVQKDSMIADSRNLKEQLCDYLVENDMVQENDVIRHSYSISRIDDWEHRRHRNT